MLDYADRNRKLGLEQNDSSSSGHHRSGQILPEDFMGSDERGVSPPAKEIIKVAKRLDSVVKNKLENFKNFIKEPKESHQDCHENSFYRDTESNLGRVLKGISSPKKDIRKSSGFP
jgi:hypothetical protein